MLILALAVAGIAAPVASGAFIRTGTFSGPGAGDGELTSPGGAVVRQSDGKLFVADGGNDRIEVFAPTSSGGVYDSQISDPSIDDPRDVAIDQATGAVYVADVDGIVKLNSDLTPDAGWTDPMVTGPLAFDPTTDELVVADVMAKVVRRYTPSGTAGATFDGTNGGDPFKTLLDIDVDSSGDVLVVDADGDRAAVTFGQDSTVLRYGGGGQFEEPIGSIPAPAAVAVIPGTDEVLVGGNIAASYTFGQPLLLGVYSADGSEVEQIDLPNEGSQTYSDFAALAATGGSVPRIYGLTDLDAPGAFWGTVAIHTYQAIDPAAPSVTTEVASAVATTTVKLNGLVNPNQRPTTYRFEYGTTSSYGSSLPITGGADAGSGFEPVDVGRYAGGLQPGTTYHFRLVAENDLGTVEGADRTFVTRPKVVTPPNPGTGPGDIPGRATLPDNRGWELVSPPNKLANDIASPDVEGLIGAVAADGDSAGLQARNAFGDAPQSAPSTTHLIAVRAANGWTSRSIDPPMAPRPGLNTTLHAWFSDDLTRSVYQASGAVAPLTDDPGEAPDIRRLYQRDNLADSYRLASPMPANYSGIVQWSNASSDFSHIVVYNESGSDVLTSDAPLGPSNTYVWADGQLSLVTILPDGTPAPNGGVDGAFGPANGFAGGNQDHAVSADGSRIFFTADGQLYVRENGVSTTHVSATKRALPDPDGTQSATYWNASRDGSYAFFTSAEDLTDESDTGTAGGSDLYRFDTDTDSLVDLTPQTNPAGPDGAQVQRVLEVSDDGSYVYFVANGQLVAGEGAPGAPNLYLSHDGQTTFVATLDAVPHWHETRVTPSGSHLAFESTAPLTSNSVANPSTGQPERQVYLYEAATDTMACASCAPDGAPPLGPAQFVTASVEVYPPAVTKPRNLTRDGSRVFFGTPNALVGADVNGVGDVYQYDDEPHLLSSGRSDDASGFYGASADGDDVFFLTRERLVPQDEDQNRDVYDARVGGGFPLPPESASPCLGDDCQGLRSVPPVPPTAGSMSLRDQDKGLASRLARPRVSRVVTVRGPSAWVSVRVAARGVIRISGSSLRVSRRTARRAGTYRVAVKLSRRARQTLRRKNRVTVRIVVRFTSAAGRTQSERVRVTFNRQDGKKGGR